LEAITVEKYIGRVVQINYEDKAGKITKQTTRVREVTEGKIKAFDYDRNAPRVFDADRILAVQPVGRTA
jgi:predicted DNA-binding transcriptional regulator YafY